MSRSRRNPAAESIIKGKRPMMGNVHPASPSSVHNKVRMIEPHVGRAKRQSDFKSRHGYGLV